MSKNWDVDRIVAEVVQRLGRLSHAPRDIASTSSTTADKPISTGTLALTDAVVSMATLRGQLAGIDRLVVSTGAVLTPAVMDLLRQEGVVVERQGQGRMKSSRRFLVLASQCVDKPDEWFAELTELAVDTVEPAELESCVAQVARHLRNAHSSAVLLTAAPALAACQANRHQHIRAAVAFNPRQFEQACRECRANVMVVRPTSRTELRQLVKAFQNWQQEKGGLS